MITVVFAALFASVSASADTGTACLDASDVCTGAAPAAGACAISTDIVVPSGCDLDLSEYDVSITASGSVTMSDDMTLRANTLVMASRPGGDRSAGLRANCGPESCGELHIDARYNVTLEKIDLSGQPLGREGSSLRIDANGDVVLNDDVLLEGRGLDGKGGDLFIEAPKIYVNALINSSGKQTGFSGGTAGSITLHATNLIDIQENGDIRANGKTPGKIKVIAATSITMNERSTIASKMGDPSECAVDCTGSIHLNSEAITVNGTLDAARGAGSTATGGNIWIQAADRMDIDAEASFELGGGSDAASGTLRLDGGEIHMRGSVNGRLAATVPEYGAQLSFVGRDLLYVYSEARIDAGGDGTYGGRIELIAGESILTSGAIDAGSKANAAVFIHSRLGQVLLNGAIDAVELPAPSTSAERLGIHVDACQVKFGGDASLNTADGLLFIGRGETEDDTAWSLIAMGDEPSLVGNFVRFHSPELTQLTTISDLLGDHGAEFEFATDSALSKCGTGSATDFDGDGESWQRLGTTGTYTDCDDYDASVNSNSATEVWGDGVDSNCACGDTVGLANAYAEFLYRADESIPVACDTDSAGEPPAPGDTAEPNTETGAPPIDSGTPDATATDSGIIVGSAGRSDTVVRGCACAHGTAPTGAWLGIGALFGLALCRRRGPVA